MDLELELLALPAFTDNYIWMLHNGTHAIVVDPGEAAPVTHALDANSLKLAGILVTHHHGDHVMGIEALLPRLHGPVLGPALENIPCRTQAVREGDRLQLLNLTWQVLDVPGHTAGHVAYLCEAVPLSSAGAHPIIFCGDTLFSAGCGRLFEGSPEQMARSLQRLADLPDDTHICAAHEYTLANLAFAQAVEPSNTLIANALQHARQQRAQHQPTLPSTLKQERLINPFLRCLRADASAELQRSAQRHGANQPTPVARFAALRRWKNEFPTPR